MKKISSVKKQQINGGIAPMAAWIGVMGITMVGNLVSNVITSITDKVTQVDNFQKNNSYSNQKKGAYVRMSPFPSRSAVSMWI